jgi:rhomboid protease GluP
VIEADNGPRPRAEVDSQKVDPSRADPQAEVAAAIAHFQLALREVTPRVWVVPAIIAVNVAVFGAMVASGVSFMSPGADAVIRWGANFGPKTLGGQPWRLLANCFLHFGVIHLLMNMWALWDTGHLVERLFGQARTAALYLAAGICGSLASVVMHPHVTSAGASGAVFGVYGALGAFLLRQRGVIPPHVVSRLGRVAAAFIGYNLIYGFANPNIDNAAHIGGLLGGAAAGAWLARPLVPGRSRGAAGAAAVLVFSALLGVGVAAAMPRPPNLDATLGAFSAAEGRIIGVYNELIERSHRHQLTDADLSNRIERDVLPPWREARKQLTAPTRWMEPQRALIRRLDRYAAAREQTWIWLAEAGRTQDPAAMEKLKEAEAEVTKAMEELKQQRP